MKKIFTMVMSLALIFLLGCSAQEEQGYEKGNIEDTTKEQEQVQVQVIENKNREETSETNSINTNKYEEIRKINEKIHVQDYNIHVESDSKGTRIILFEINEKNMYKSVFVKGKRQLKLIDLESGEKPLINEKI